LRVGRGVANEKCDDLSGKPKSTCVKQAPADHTQAKANAQRGKRTD